MNDIKKIILDEIKNSLKKVQQIEIENRAKAKFKTRRSEIKKVIKELVANKDLEYVSEYGLSYLQLSFNKPVKLSNRIVIKPLDKEYHPAENEMVININEGIAFGSGRHPTTVLSLNAIDIYLEKKIKMDNGVNPTAIDIGTGSGILAIAAVKLGVKKALGLDIDPVAIHEAAVNVRLNHLENEIEISDRQVDKIENTFDWVFANLRYPTLKSIFPIIKKITNREGTVIFSGFKEYEIEKLISVYTQGGFKSSYVKTEKEWACAVFERE